MLTARKSRKPRTRYQPNRLCKQNHPFGIYNEPPPPSVFTLPSPPFHITSPLHQIKITSKTTYYTDSTIFQRNAVEFFASPSPNKVSKQLVYERNFNSPYIYQNYHRTCLFIYGGQEAHAIPDPLGYVGLLFQDDGTIQATTINLDRPLLSFEIERRQSDNDYIEAQEKPGGMDMIREQGSCILYDKQIDCCTVYNSDSTITKENYTRFYLDETPRQSNFTCKELRNREHLEWERDELGGMERMIESRTQIYLYGHNEQALQIPPPRSYASLGYYYASPDVGEVSADITTYSPDRFP